MGQADAESVDSRRVIYETSASQVDGVLVVDVGFWPEEFFSGIPWNAEGPHFSEGEMNVQNVTLLVLFSLAAASWDDRNVEGDRNEIVSPSDASLIPEDVQVAILDAANLGDLQSIRRLIAHYDALSGYDEQAEQWKARARELGDAQELYNHAARLFSESRGELDPERRSVLLGDALKFAQRSNESRASSSAWKLIDEVSRAIAGEK